MSHATSSYFCVIRRAEALVSATYYAELAKNDLGGLTLWAERSAKQRRMARERAGKAAAQAAGDFRVAVEAFDEWVLQRATVDVVAASERPAAVQPIDGIATEFPVEDDLSFLPRFQPPGLRDLARRTCKLREEHQYPGITVVGSLDHLPKDYKGGVTSLRAQFKSLENRHVPLVGVDAPAGVYADLVDRFPWAEGAIETIIKEVGRSETVRLRPTLLVGPPGSGKTKLAMELANALGLHPTKYSCAGVADASFAGTSRQWSNARASVALQAVQRTQIANPCIILDEIEKTASDKRNGSLLDSLLDFLERDNARKVFDPALECPVDLSGVIYIATANLLAGLPAAIADRFRILHVDAPGPKHLQELVTSILDDHAAAEDLDRRWIPDLDGDELEALRTVWKGGSVRPLKAAIEATLQAREEFAPRM